MTLRKIGFDTETITNEYNLSEKLLTFNPDYIIVKGGSSRVSGLQIGKKLKETVKYSGKVVLIFPADQKPKPEELIKLRMDLLLFEPISVLNLVGQLLTLTTVDRDAVMDKLLKMAHTDSQFRQNEQQIIKNTGTSIDSEIQQVISRLKAKFKPEVPDTLDENLIHSFVDPKYKAPAPPAAPVAEENPPSPTVANAAELQLGKVKVIPKENLDANYNHPIDLAYKQNLQEEISVVAAELPLRIDTYNHAIKTVDQDLKKGLSKRMTKKSALLSASETTAAEKQERDQERIQFANALWKKDKGE